MRRIDDPKQNRLFDPFANVFVVSGTSPPRPLSRDEGVLSVASQFHPSLAEL